MKNIFSRSTFISLVLYLLFIKFVIPSDLSNVARNAFVLYALFIFWIVWKYTLEPEHLHDRAAEKKFFLYLLLGSAIFFVATRMILFIRYGEAPLGYDTGFYLESMREAFNDIGGARTVRTFLWIPFRWLGIPEVFILHGLYVLFQFLIIGSLYTLARTLKVSSRLQYGAVAVFLFTVSLPQFFAFWWMFYQMELAIAFLLMTFMLIHKRSLLAIVTGGFGAAMHPATFFPFGIALGVFSIFQVVRALIKRKRPEKETVFIISVGLVLLIVVPPFVREFLLAYLQGSVNQYGWFLTDYPPHIRQMFTGLYINFRLFQLANIYLLPFSGLGIILFLLKKLRDKEGVLFSRLLGFFVFLAVLLLLSYYPFIYQNRFLILLDLILIIFAVYPIVHLLKHFLTERVGRVVVGILIFGFTMFNGFVVWTQDPHLHPDELQDIRAIAQISMPSDYAMATESVYTPWVSAFSRRTTIDPGFLSANRWDYSMWREFWYEPSNARRFELLGLYEHPIYLFIGKSTPETVRYKKMILNDPHFIRVNQHVWYYDPRSVGDDEIKLMYQKEAGGTIQKLEEPASIKM